MARAGGVGVETVRYYQRPDATSLELDPTATEMNGFASTVQIRKASGVTNLTDPGAEGSFESLKKYGIDPGAYRASG